MPMRTKLSGSRRGIVSEQAHTSSEGREMGGDRVAFNGKGLGTYGEGQPLC
jgi:hypothetical protein